jgi:8-oxo-dGTP diphosphatase
MLTCKFESGRLAKLRHVTCGVIINFENQVLLIKRANVTTEPFKWGLPGGYVDRDENIFQAIARETLEETGYQIHEPRLFLINHKPNRRNEDRQNIDFIFTASVGNKIGEHDFEIEEVKWFKFDLIPQATDMAFDHGLVLKKYFESLDKPIKLPILDFDY